MKLVILFFLFTCSLLPAASFAADGTAWRDSIPEPYKGEGTFVEGPAFVGGSIGLVGGVVIGIIPAIGAGVVGWTVDIAALAGGEKTEGSYSMKYGKAVHGAIAKGCMYTVLYVVGAPFYIVKKVFYDFPRYLVSGSVDASTPTPVEPGIPSVPLQNSPQQISRNESAAPMTANLC